ncbi:MAG TPA: hypothetical protein VFW85_01745 [Gaiellaceae bacterium]|nr:hypothetical protein [Gaiellaceae bacterium]
MILIAAFALALSPVHPWPIGVGPRYQLPATTPAVRAGICAPRPVQFAAHVEVFARRRVVVLPQGIGVGRNCRYSASTNSPTGVVRLTRQVTLGDLFRIWGQPLGTNRLLSFRGATLAFVGGKRWSGDPRRIRLTAHAQVVVEIGGYVAPHPSYLFPKGMP